MGNGEKILNKILEDFERSDQAEGCATPAGGPGTGARGGAAAGGGPGTGAQGSARAGGREEKGAHDGAAKITNQFTNN